MLGGARAQGVNTQLVEKQKLPECSKHPKASIIVSGEQAA